MVLKGAVYVYVFVYIHKKYIHKKYTYVYSTFLMYISHSYVYTRRPSTWRQHRQIIHTYSLLHLECHSISISKLNLSLSLQQNLAPEH